MAAHAPASPAVGAGTRSGPDLVLLAAGLLTCGMALYHFWLPFAWRWGDALTHAPMLRWALFMLNASFSFLLLGGGVMTVAIAMRRGARDATARWVLLLMAGYWLFNGTYQLLVPMPMPAVLQPLRWALGGFALSVVLLYAAGIADRRAGASATRVPTRPSATAR
jgi:hypothetical protein